MPFAIGFLSGYAEMTAILSFLGYILLAVIFLVIFFFKGFGRIIQWLFKATCWIVAKVFPLCCHAVRRLWANYMAWRNQRMAMNYQ